MKNLNRELMVVVKQGLFNQYAIEKEMERLDRILDIAESPRNFCKAHELADRNRITQKHEKILNATRCAELKPFRFLIGKN
jgi:hypothetical protein